ncbi:MAG: sugar phosphate isomerase/epimerase family protein, partial [Chloroflexota bacterium]
MIRIAFSTISCPDYTIEQIAAAAHAYEYDGVELYALAGQRLLPNELGAHLPSLRRAFGPDGIPIVCLNSWAHLSSADATERAAQEARITRAFELASELQCPLVKMFGGDLPEGLSTAWVYDYMAEAIIRLCRQARRLGVRLVLETHDGFSRGATLAELLQRVSDPAFGALWDIYHPYRMG